MSKRWSNSSRVIVFFYLSVPLHWTLWLTVHSWLWRSPSPLLFPSCSQQIQTAGEQQPGARWGGGAPGEPVLKLRLHGKCTVLIQIAVYWVVWGEMGWNREHSGLFPLLPEPSLDHWKQPCHCFILSLLLNFMSIPITPCKMSGII